MSSVAVDVANVRPAGPARHLQLLRRPSTLVGAVLVGVCVVLAVLSLNAHGAAYDNHLVERLQPPLGFGGSAAHPLGTDSLGRDVLARIMTGLRISLLIGLVAVLLSGVAGVVLGVVSGYTGGWVDDVIMRFADAVLAIPLVLLAISVIAVLGSDIPKLVAVIAFSQWMTFARTARGEAQVVTELPYVLAARAIGARGWWILVRHVLPHVIPSAIVLATLNVSTVVLLEAGLSYLGLGVQPPNPSLGSMMTEGQQYVARASWLAVLPGCALVVLVLGFNLLGEGIRAHLDPHSRSDLAKTL